MKKKIFAAIAAVMLLISCVPFISGCSASVAYELNFDKDGNGSYTVSVKGFSSALKGELEIPAYYSDEESGQEYPVKAIASEGFGDTRITKVTIPETVTEIGSGAFYCCSVLEEVIFAEDSKITSIPSSVFGFCEALRSVVIPETVKTLGVGVFYKCYSLESISLPQGLELIGARTFYECGKLTAVTIPDTVRIIGDEAFYASGITEIIIPSSVSDMEYTDENKDKQVLPGIGYGAFWACESLKVAVVNAEIKTLKSSTFGYCIALEDIYLPKTLTTVEGALFVNGGTFYCGHAFHNDPALKNVYCAGSEEQWNNVKIENTSYKKNGVTYDNSALINAKKTFDKIYEG